MDRGVAWLLDQQHSEGYWSTADHPAITALVLTGCLRNPHPPASAEYQDHLDRGLKFLLESVQSDGGIYRKPLLQNYNTSVSLMALLAADRPEYRTAILKARGFLIGSQSDFGERGKLDHVYDGGIGYGSRYPHSDLSNTLHALEALYHSRHLVADQSLSEGGDLNWEAARRFIERCQNRPESNPQAWASSDPANRGGFIYFPGHSMAGNMQLAGGRTVLRSYGSMSYAGLLSMIYAGVEGDDPRVLAVRDWLRGNYTLQENPGMGLQGLYFYYHTMAKGLTVAGVDRLRMANGKDVDWRQELLMMLLQRQGVDGSWVNEHPRWWENDPVLVTAYATLTLAIIHRGLQ